jgi:hypothetical protein
MNAQLFREIADAVNVVEETELPGRTKHKMVMEVIQRSLGSDAYIQHETLLGLMIDAIVAMKRDEQTDAPVSVDIPIRKRRSMFSFLCCLNEVKR